jgi:hypothetical protein
VETVHVVACSSLGDRVGTRQNVPAVGVLCKKTGSGVASADKALYYPLVSEEAQDAAVGCGELAGHIPFR